MANQISPLAFVHPDAKLGDNNIIGPFCYIDADVVIGNNNVFQNSVTLNQGLRMGDNNEVMPGASLSTKPQDLKFKGEVTTCQIGNSCIIGNSTKFAGEVIVDDCAIISAEVLVHQFVHIGGYVMIQGGSRTSQDIPPYVIGGKEPIAYEGLNIIGLRRRGFSPELIDNIHNAYRLVYQSSLTVNEAMERIKNDVPMSKEIQYIVDFVSNSKRGIIR